MSNIGFMYKASRHDQDIMDRLIELRKSPSGVSKYWKCTIVHGE